MMALTHRNTNWVDPALSGLARKVKYILSKLEMKAWLNAADVVVEKVTSIRYWKEWCFICTEIDWKSCFPINRI